jgi:hypothetical protein
MAGEILKGVKLSGQDARVVSTTAFHRLGSLGETDDGRKYRYCLAGAAITRGQLVQAQAQTANHRNIAVAAAAAIGATSVTVTLGATAATANQYADGVLVVDDLTGEGIAYKILSHPAADGDASLVLTLEEPVQVALDTTSQVTLTPSLYRDVQTVASQARIAVGVPNVTVADNEFFWAQTWGLCSAFGGDTSTIGQVLTQDAAVAGEFEARDADTEQALAIAQDTQVVGEYFSVKLIIE